MSKKDSELKRMVRKGFYAGVGLGVTITEVIDKSIGILSEKGEKTLPFSKVDNKELKHKPKADKK